MWLRSYDQGTAEPGSRAQACKRHPTWPLRQSVAVSVHRKILDEHIFSLATKKQAAGRERNGWAPDS